MEFLNQIYQQLATASLGAWLVVIPLTFIIWFIPTLLAIFFNRKHLKKIFIVNIPAGFSFVAWGACIAWAISGKVSERFKSKEIT
jgi:hypothetical protein